MQVFPFLLTYLCEKIVIKTDSCLGVQKNMEVFLNAGRAKINAFKAKRWEEIAN